MITGNSDKLSASKKKVAAAHHRVAKLLLMICILPLSFWIVQPAGTHGIQNSYLPILEGNSGQEKKEAPGSAKEIVVTDRLHRNDSSNKLSESQTTWRNDTRESDSGHDGGEEMKTISTRTIRLSSPITEAGNKKAPIKPISVKELNTTLSVVEYCVPLKVGSSVSNLMHDHWQALPNENKTFPNGKQYAIVRDPLERLWSGYWNKCLHQIKREKTQCPNFPGARLYPPSFEEWLTKCTANSTEFMRNDHFKAMSKACDLDSYQHVFYLSSPTFNQQIAALWQSYGLSKDLTERWFPTTKPRALKDYHAGAANATHAHYTNVTLRLALKLLKDDYQGNYSKYFPLPNWAQTMLSE